MAELRTEPPGATRAERRPFGTQSGTPSLGLGGDREQRILDAALSVLTEVGYEHLTMDAVAKRARASKATLYRHWRTKARLVLQALTTATAAPQIETNDTGSLRPDLIATFSGNRAMSGLASDIFGAVGTAVSIDPELATEFRRLFIAPKLQTVRALYERAQARGELRDDVDLDVIVPALPALLLYYSLLAGSPIDDADVERVIDVVILPAVGTGPAVELPGSARHRT